MEPKPISPVIVTFKALPGVRVVAVKDTGVLPCTRCRLEHASAACSGDDNPKGHCISRDYIWREVGEK